MAEQEEKRSSCLTINGTLYRTAGNIDFCTEDEGRYYLAESQTLNKMDQAIQQGMLGNGMQHLLKSLR